MADINKSIFTGRIGSDIELRMTQIGVPTCTFNLAVDRPKAKDAEKAETDWLTMVAWRSTAEFCSRYLAKGRKVVVEATARMRKWDDKDGKTHKVVEFQVLNILPADSKQQSVGTAPVQYGLPPQTSDFAELLSDEDLPF